MSTQAEREVAHDAVTASDPCFLCAFGPPGTRPCDVPVVQGLLLRVAERVGGSRDPAVLLQCADGSLASVILNAQARTLAQALVRLGPERWKGLRLRVFHLADGAPAPHAEPPPADVIEQQGGLDVADSPSAPREWGQGARSHRRHLRATPASVAVLESDLLLNITDINNAAYCVRHYPLRRMVPSPPTTASLRGTVVHRAFEELLKSGRGAPADVATHLERALGAQVTNFALRQISYAQAAADAEPHLGALAAWYAGQRQTLWGDAPRIRAETFLLAPEVGLKGRLDFLVHDQHGDWLLELKTGEVYASLPKRAHRWQVYGYQTLLAARHPADRRRPGATLLYSATPGQAEGYGIPFTLRDLHRVLELRNLLALTHATGAVPAPPGGNTCGRCMLRRVCVRASTLLGWEPPPTEDPDVTLAPQDAAWFAEQHEQLRLEARAAETEGQLLWRLTPEQRRAAGSALGGLRPLGEPQPTTSGEWEYTFTCEHTSELREGDAILLSDGDPVRGAVVTGTILRLAERTVTVWTPERIAQPTLIDRYESEIVHDRTVRNLWRWLEVEPRLRALVSGELAPSFDSSFDADESAELPAVFNPEQREAARRARAARDYLLIQGPPGTGKTSVVAAIARRALERGERVLAAAFTNQAVDNVLRRLVAEGGHDLVRLGHELSVAADLRPYRLAARAGADPAALREALRRAPLVASTAATWASEIYDDAGDLLRFDLALVDEATQLTVPALLGILRFARRFVLVGDEHQLPPLVRSAEAAQRGLKRSLFAHLFERWGERAGVTLTRQYRMHPIICAFPSAEFYGGELVAEGAARDAMLAVELPPRHPLAAVLDPGRPMVFVDVAAGEEERMPARAVKASPAQAEVARRIALAVRGAGVPAEEIGIIAPYRAQVALIRRLLAASGEGGITVDTVDRFQGAERQVILFTLGGRVAPGAAHDGLQSRGNEFLADPHRLNVALTRAQRKLVVIGDRRRSEEIPVLRRLVRYCQALYGGRGGCVTAHYTVPTSSR
jgi:DNA replication ATP-dependent helicase Dna2